MSRLRGFLIALAVVAIAAIVAVFTTWHVAVLGGPRKPLVPVTNGTFTASYAANALCADGRRIMSLTLVYHNKKLTRIVLGGYEIPLEAFRYPHEIAYIGELLSDLNNIDRVNNKTIDNAIRALLNMPDKVKVDNIEALRGFVKKRPRGPANLDRPYSPLMTHPNTLMILTSFNYPYLEIKDHGAVKNGVINGSMLIFDKEAGVPYFFHLFIIHNSLRRICGRSYAYMHAYLQEVCTHVCVPKRS